jgi:hypothetical protein
VFYSNKFPLLQKTNPKAKETGISSSVLLGDLSVWFGLLLLIWSVKFYVVVN